MRILICGAAGRMGRMVAECASERGETVVCGVDVVPMSAEYPVYPNFEAVGESADVIIDFSSAEGLSERLRFAEARGIPILLGATGYSADDEALICAYAQRIPIFKSGNLSLGISLLQTLAERAAAVLKDFDVEIIERHHSAKKDAPSGTALMLAERVEKVRGGDLVYGRKGMTGPRSKSEIGIHAVRGGNIVGEHEVMFAGEDEIVTFSHSARSRKVFAAGALSAARWLCTAAAGLYGMQDMLNDMLG